MEAGYEGYWKELAQDTVTVLVVFQFVLTFFLNLFYYLQLLLYICVAAQSRILQIY